MGEDYKIYIGVSDGTGNIFYEFFCLCSVFEKSRMSFPTPENYAEMSKYDKEFKM